MASDVNVIFLKDVRGKAKAGQEKVVKLGYAINYLIPQGYAVLRNKNNLFRMTSIVKRSQAIKKQLDGKVIQVKEKTHDRGKLYGSITATDVKKHVADLYGVTIEKQSIVLYEAIKRVGDYQIGIQLPQEVDISVLLKLESENEDLSAGSKLTKKSPQSQRRQRDDYDDDAYEDVQGEETSVDSDVADATEGEDVSSESDDTNAVQTEEASSESEATNVVQVDESSAEEDEVGSEVTVEASTSEEAAS